MRSFLYQTEKTLPIFRFEDVLSIYYLFNFLKISTKYLEKIKSFYLFPFKVLFFFEVYGNITKVYHSFHDTSGRGQRLGKMQLPVALLT